MDADEGGAPDPSDGGVMKTRLGIRWARSNDKKLGRKVQRLLLFVETGHN